MTNGSHRIVKISIPTDSISEVLSPKPKKMEIICLLESNSHILGSSKALGESFSPNDFLLPTISGFTFASNWFRKAFRSIVGSNLGKFCSHAGQDLNMLAPGHHSNPEKVAKKIVF